MKWMEYNIELFTYVKESKKLVTQASTLGLIVGQFPKQITVVGKTTKVLFELQHIHAADDFLSYIPHSSWKGTPTGELVLFVLNT